MISDDIDVHVDESARFDAALKVGDVTTEVEVTAAAPLLQSDRADVAQTSLPRRSTIYRTSAATCNPWTLLEPGSAKFGWQHASDENPQGSVQMVVNGQLFSQWATSWMAPPTRTRFSESSLSTRHSIHCPKSSRRSRTSMPNSIWWAAALPPTPPSPAPTQFMARLRIYSDQHARLHDVREQSVSSHAVRSLPAEPVWRLNRRPHDQKQVLLLRRRPVEPAVPGRHRS